MNTVIKVCEVDNGDSKMSLFILPLNYMRVIYNRRTLLDFTQGTEESKCSGNEQVLSFNLNNKRRYIISTYRRW